MAGLGSGDRLSKSLSQPSNCTSRSPAPAHRGMPSTAKFLNSQVKIKQMNKRKQNLRVSNFLMYFVNTIEYLLILINSQACLLANAFLL